MKCIICDNELFLKKYAMGIYGIYRCQQCGFEITHDITEKDLVDFYEKDYFDGKTANYKSGGYLDEVSPGKIEILNKYYPKTVIEIGPSPDGGMAKWFKESSYIRYIEPSKYASNVLQQNGCKVFNGELCDDIYHGYDLCIATEVIEHGLSPDIFLRHIYSKLNPNGTLILSTGNTSSLTAKIMGDKWYYRDPPAHVNYFNNVNIKTLLQKTGFKNIKVYNYGFETITTAIKFKIKFVLPLISRLNLMTGMIIEATK